MHARVVNFTLGPGTMDAATAMADEGFKIAKSLNGFVSAVYMIHDEGAGKYGSVTVWQTEADADAAAEALRPLMAKAGDKLKGTPEVSKAEVYEPK